MIINLPVLNTIQNQGSYHSRDIDEWNGRLVSIKIWIFPKKLYSTIYSLIKFKIKI